MCAKFSKSGLHYVWNIRNHFQKIYFYKTTNNSRIAGLWEKNETFNRIPGHLKICPKYYASGMKIKSNYHTELKIWLHVLLHKNYLKSETLSHKSFTNDRAININEVQTKSSLHPLFHKKNYHLFWDNEDLPVSIQSKIHSIRLKAKILHY